MRFVALVALLVGTAALTACSSKPDTPPVLDNGMQQGQQGEVRVPLVTTVSNRTFRLEQASFRFNGHTTKTVVAPDTAEALEVQLPIGGYEVQLLDGWRLVELLPNGVVRTVDAVVIGNNPLHLDVSSTAASEAVFQLQLVSAGDAEVGVGRVRFEVALGTCQRGTCESLGYECGQAVDNCGSPLSCGTCESGTCSASNKCEAVCQPQTCQELNRECGTVTDRCGTPLNCGQCQANQVCNANGRCENNCQPQTCLELNRECGTVTDRCGTSLNCGQCGANQVCNADGRCENNCQPQTCQELNRECGTVTDRCGTSLNCGQCSNGRICDSTGRCVDECKPKTCGNRVCGTIDDECGHQVACGDCPTGSSCNAEGQCIPVCVPATCASLKAECGAPLDGCGAPLNCGVCEGGAQCSSTFTCAPVCQPRKCGDQGAQCGSVSDGCGGTLACGNCEAGTCNAGTCEAPASKVSATYKIQTQWTGGYCADVTVKNDDSRATKGWTVLVDLQGATIREAWNVNRSASGANQAFDNIGYNGPIQPKGTATFGFCANTSSNKLPLVVNTTGKF